MKVLVVDDSAFMRKAITSMLQSDPMIDIVGTGRNGREAVELAAKHQPDVMTLDIEMPEMDGLTALRKIMAASPTQVLMFSSLTTEGSRAALTAMRLGAADVLAKDSSQISLAVTQLKDELLAKVRALAKARRRRPTGAPSPSPTAALPVYRAGQFDVICIGSSTGGPPVLERVLPKVPENISAPIVVAQHMPQLFTKSMAERLNEVCRIPVVHAEDGMPLANRTIYIAPGGRNIHIHKIGLAKYQLKVNDLPANATYRPSVDALFSSAAAANGSRALGIVFTGIGDDGLRGGRELAARGGKLLAQNEETCVVYGMPKSVTQAGLVDASLTPEQVGQLLMKLGSGGAGFTRRAG